MVKITCLLLLLIVIAVGVSMAEKDCRAVYDPNRCDLYECRANCYLKYTGSGYCEPLYPAGQYCLCVFDCPK
nr:hypothetical protein [Tanacetum cinerariifolium]